METLIYERDGSVARITLDRPSRGNGITPRMPVELAECVERANLDPEVHVIALAGNGTGFCGGYDLVASAEGDMGELGGAEVPAGSPLDPATIGTNHAPETNWDPVTDFQFMSRNVRGFMSLFHSEKPVLCKVHGYCVAGGTDMALCSDLLVIAEDAKIGYPPARVWGSPTTAMWAHRLGPMRAKRLLLTGDSLTGAEAAEWGLATEAAPAAELDARFERLLERVARMPINQLVMMKLLVNQSDRRPGPAAVAGARHLLRRHRPPHRGGPRLRPPRRRVRLPRGGARARRALRRPRPGRLRGELMERADADLSQVTTEHARGFLQGSFPGDLGIEPLEIEDTHARGRIVVDRRHLHPGGFVHGGAWTALGDTVAAWATFRNIPAQHDFTTIELKLNVFGSGLPATRSSPTPSRSTSAAPRL